VTPGQEKMVRRFRAQADNCATLGSPLYAALLADAADDAAAGGPVWRAAAPLAELPGGALGALRFLGASHRLALDGSAPALAATYPSCGGSASAAHAWKALRALCDEVADTPRWLALLDQGVQTNEVGRAAALLGGFLTVARATALPLRVLEVGTSAGLNLRWDLFRYGSHWGPADSPVDQGSPWVGVSLPSFAPSTVDIVSREGCDVAPIDPLSDDGRLTLLSYVWPDMDRRFHLLEAACSVAAAVPASVSEESADTWLHGKLASPAPGVATVVFHSVFLQYVPTDARAALLATLADAGRNATADAPLAWLRLEPPGALGPPDFEVCLCLWPGGEDRRLGTCHPHGVWVRWDG